MSIPPNPAAVQPLARPCFASGVESGTATTDFAHKNALIRKDFERNGS